jgi:hypothetical protein
MNSKVTNLYPRINPDMTAMQMLTSIGTGTNTVFGAFQQTTRYVSLDVQDNDVYVSYDGTNPDADHGHILYAGNSYTWHKETAKAAIFNSVGGTATIAASEFTD